MAMLTRRLPGSEADARALPEADGRVLRQAALLRQRLTFELGKACVVHASLQIRIGIRLLQNCALLPWRNVGNASTAICFLQGKRCGRGLDRSFTALVDPRAISARLDQEKAWSYRR